MKVSSKSATTRRSAWLESNGALLKEASLFQDYAEKRPKRPLCEV